MDHMFELHKPAPLRARMQAQSRDQIELTLVGEVDVATAPTLAPMADLLAQLEPSAVTLRLSRVAAVDIAGRRALEQLSERLEHTGIDVTVASTSAEPMTPLASPAMSSESLQHEGQRDLLPAAVAAPTDSSATRLASAT
jgi:anti-anti-sigma regulatory factor